MTATETAKAYVMRWFCHNNEILWERGGHYKEEVAALTAALQAHEQAVWEAAAKYGQQMIDAYPLAVFIETPFGQHGETIDACSARMGRHTGKLFHDYCRAQAAKGKP